MELIIVTGQSGAGKSFALNCLEDLGYYCIDNMPPALIESFIDLMKMNPEMDKAAICVDARAGKAFRTLVLQLDKLNDVNYRIFFLEASNNTLIRRFSENRRAHPLCESNVEKGIEIEKEILADVRKRADNIIDTSHMKTAKLKELIRDIVVVGEEKNTFTINISSFGYKHGMPQDADMVFDVRFIPNPYYVPYLKDYTGNSRKVSSFVLRQDITAEFFAKSVPLLVELIPAFMKEGKYNLNIACGCTGGHHRSVAVANEFARIFREKGYRVTIDHRDL